MKSAFFTQRELDAVLRHDLAPFVHKSFRTLTPAQTYHDNWHIEAIAWHLEQCASGTVKRLLITLPPRSLKSISVVACEAWLLGRDPSKRLICASYSADLAGKHAQDCRALMESSWYRRIFPQTRIEKNTETEFVTSRKGYRYSTSVGGTLTGRGGDMLIIDDLMKSEDALSETKRSAVNDWYDGTLYSRLDDKRDGVIILIMQRQHLDDLAGHVLGQEDWIQLNLPAIAEIDEQIRIGPNQGHFRRLGDLLHPEREPREVLARVKSTLGSFKFSAQYQQRPVPEEGEIIKLGWFRHYDAPPQRLEGDEIVQSWDTANKAEELSDYSVCTTWLVSGNQYYLLHVLREKLNYPDLRRVVVEHAKKYEADSLVIENKGSGILLIDDLRQGGGRYDPVPIPFDPEGDKVTRMSAQSAQLEAGKVLLPREAPWLDEFKAELMQFPHARYDDQVDSLSQFLKRMKTRVSFSVDWGDPPPTTQGLYGSSLPSGGSRVFATPNQNVKIKVVEKVNGNYRTVYLSPEEYSKRICR